MKDARRKNWISLLHFKTSCWLDRPFLHLLIRWSFCWLRVWTNWKLKNTELIIWLEYARARVHVLIWSSVYQWIKTCSKLKIYVNSLLLFEYWQVRIFFRPLQSEAPAAFSGRPSSAAPAGKTEVGVKNSEAGFWNDFLWNAANLICVHIKFFLPWTPSFPEQSGSGRGRIWRWCRWIWARWPRWTCEMCARAKTV